MEQTLPTPKSVRIRQNIAAGLLVLTDIFWLLRIFLPTEPLVTAIVGAVHIAAWGLLCSTASNKASRVASIIIIVFALIATALSYYFSAASTPSIFVDIFHFIKHLTSIYAYSILLKGNSDIDSADRTWVGFIILSAIGMSMLQFYYLGFGHLFPQGDWHFYQQYNFAWSVGWYIWNIAYYILMAVAEFRVAKCAAFAGNYTTEPAPKGTYSPINKYFAALLITAPIVLGLLWVVYSNLESIESIF